MAIKDLSLKLAAISLLADQAKRLKDELRAELQAEMNELGADRVKAGIPDCMILDQRHGYSGLAIELKVGYNKPSEHQLAIFDKLVERKWMWR